MGISQIPDQIRRAPAEALRAVFAGIGRILLAADRPGQAPTRTQPDATTARTTSAAQADRQRRTEPSRPAAESRWRSLDQTGNVRLLSADEIDDYDLAGPAEESGVNGSVPESGTPALPLADYDKLSLPSIRARLRALSPEELHVLADYERKNAERSEVIGMLERRIEKLESGGDR
jgi:hypothetical protein